MSTRQWSYERFGAEFGPLGIADLQSLARSKSIDPGTILIHENGSRVLASDVLDFGEEDVVADGHAGMIDQGRGAAFLPPPPPIPADALGSRGVNANADFRPNAGAGNEVTDLVVPAEEKRTTSAADSVNKMAIWYNMLFVVIPLVGITLGLLPPSAGKWIPHFGSRYAAMCDPCGGKGTTKVSCTACRGLGYYNGVSCRACKGTGKVDQTCAFCGGSGKKPEKPK